MTKRTWHKKSPPFIGWWNASLQRRLNIWRWWNGKNWSCGVDSKHNKFTAYRSSLIASPNQNDIEWNDYWPKNARVLRKTLC